MKDKERIRLLPKVNLTYINSNKFKTACISVSFLAQLSRETASKNALIPYVLRRGSLLHKDMNDIDMALNDMYGAAVECYVRKKGEIQAFGFYSEFPEDDFLPGNTCLLEQVSSLLGELILSPNTRGGIFLQKYVDSERKNLIDRINSEINNKILYSSKRLLENMCADEAYGVSALGTVEAAEAITAIGLTRYYKSILADTEIEIFYCGSADLQRVKAAILHAFSGLPRNDSAPSCFTDVLLAPQPSKPAYISEKLDVTQAKLSIGFRVGEAMSAPNYPVLQVLNGIFGGCLTSKLFRNVREKLSLAYYASSNIDIHKGIITVHCGIERSMYEQALHEILFQLDEIKAGNISDEELESSKLSAITSYKTSNDSLISLEDIYFDTIIAGIDISPEDLAALTAIVTKQEVISAAHGIALDTVYLLEGNGGGADV